MPKFGIPTLESEIEDYLIEQAKAYDCLLRKVKWVGKRSAPDRMLVFRGGRTIWVELKAPGKLKTFPRTELERAQHREHKRMREHGLEVVVVDSREGVDELFKDVPLW